MNSPSSDIDVLIIGSGAAGLSAAVGAKEAGVGSVLVAEAESVIGGSSRLSGGYMMGAGTRFQRAAGIEDDSESLFRHYLTLNAWNVDTEVVRRLCEQAGSAIEWLADRGVEFSDTLIYGGDEFVPRVHLPIDRGQGVVDVLYQLGRKLGVEYALSRRVDRLLFSDGRVYGVAVGDDEITARAVIVTSGGFGTNPDLVEKYFPSASIPNWSYYIGADGARGDHIGLGEQVDAQFTGFDRGLRLLHSNFDSTYEAYLPGWLVLVNQDGYRFCNETAPYGILDNLMRSQGDSAWAIFDRASLEYSTNLGVARYKQYRPTTNTRQSPHWITEMVDDMVSQGTMKTADTISGLADQMKIKPYVLEGTVSRVNEAAKSGFDMDFGKAVDFLDEITTAPFYAAELKPATICWTGYGLRIDRLARVLSTRGMPVTGLFAAGECTAGVIGPVYVGSGNSYANCVTYGKIAGETAADFVNGKFTEVK